MRNKNFNKKLVILPIISFVAIFVLLAPSAMIYRKSNFLIRSVVFRRGDNKETATLDVILPGSFGEEQPGGFPWEA